MKLQKVFIQILDKENPKIARRTWKETKKLQLGFPSSLKIIILNNNNQIIDNNYYFTPEDWSANDWIVSK